MALSLLVRISELREHIVVNVLSNCAHIAFPLPLLQQRMVHIMRMRGWDSEACGHASKAHLQGFGREAWLCEAGASNRERSSDGLLPGLDHILEDQRWLLLCGGGIGFCLIAIDALRAAVYRSQTDPKKQRLQ